MPKTQDTLKTDAPRGRIVSGGLKANLAANRDETLRWVEEAPLRLVAAALLDAPRRTAKVGELREALTAEVMESGRWNSWWNVVRPGLVESHRHFSYPKNKPIRLRNTNLAEIDSSSLDELRASARASKNGAAKTSAVAAAATANASASAGKTGESAAPTPDIAGLGGWVLWVQADEGEEQPLPKSVPPAQFTTVLGKQPKALAGRAISRIASGIEQRVVESNNPSDKTIESWQGALVAALNRLSGVPDQQDAAIKEVVLITARVLDKHIRPDFQDVLAWIAAYTSVGENTAKIVSDAILSASRISSLGADILLGKLSKLLDSPVRKALWLELMQSGLSQRRDGGLLVKWLEMLKVEERADAITYLLAAVQGGDSVKVVDSMLRTEWERASAKHRTRLSDAVALSWQRQNGNGLTLTGIKTMAQMEGWLKVLEPDDQYEVIAYLLRTVRDESLNEAIVPVLQSELGRADAMRRHFLFDAVVVGHEALSEYANEMVRQAIAGLAQNGQAIGGSHLSELQRMIRKESHTEVEMVRDDMNRKLEEKEWDLREKERELKEMRRELGGKDRELEYVNGRIEFLQGEIRTKRQNAELEITRDAITILGIALQELATSPTPKSDEISEAVARITLALSTLGVKPVGKIGETVAFDPRLHEADNPPTRGKLVKVTAPGMQFSRRKDNPLNVVKMQVKA